MRFSTLTSVDHKVLVEAIATAFMSYDHASDADVDPDWAVKIQENLADTMDKLSHADRAQFREDLEALAADLPADPVYDHRRNYYRALPFFLGWDESIGG